MLAVLAAGCLNKSLEFPAGRGAPDAGGGGTGNAATDPAADMVRDSGPVILDASLRDAPVPVDVRAVDPTIDRTIDRTIDGTTVPDGGAGGRGVDGAASDIEAGNYLTLERWDTQQGGFSDGQRWLAGDFDGDGLADLATVFGDDGAISADVHRSTGSTFVIQRWATHQGDFSDTQRWVVGDFDGDGRDDLADTFGDEGQITIDIHRGTGSTFAIQRWATEQGNIWDTQRWIAGDYDGDGKADLAAVFEDEGQISIDVHHSTGSAFTLQRWATEQGTFGLEQRWVAGDFDGDGKTDLAAIFEDEGQISIDVHRSTGSAFTLGRWATQQGTFGVGEKWLAGDFDGDGRADLADVFVDEGRSSIDVHQSTGSAFTLQRWATQQGSFWDAQQWVAGDIDGDGRAELVDIFSDHDQASIDVRRAPPPAGHD